MKYCAYCGASLPDESVFCPQCGKRCVESTQHTPAELSHSEEPAAVQPETQASQTDNENKKRVHGFFSVKRNRIIAVAAAIILAVAAAVFLLAGNRSSSGVPSAVMNSRNSVVRVVSEYYDGTATGSGFVVQNDRNNTYIITNAHVVEDSPHTVYILHNNKEYSADIYAINTKTDLCILRTDQAISAKALPIVDSDARQGTAVYAAGYPGAADNFSDNYLDSSVDSITITNGIVSAVRSTTIVSYGTPVTLLQINAAINHGNSGGPLFNESGKVIGINTYAAFDSQGIFAAIAASELTGFIRSNNLTYKTSNGLQLWLILLLAVAAALVVAVILFVARSKGRESKKATSAVKVASAPEKKKGSRRAPTIIAAAAVLLVAVLLFSAPFVLARAGNFSLAGKLVLIPSLTKTVDEHLADYIIAGCKLEDGDYTGASNIFQTLPKNYLNTAELVKESEYRRALKLADNQEWDDAVKYMTSLGKTGYKDSAEQVLKIRYRKAMYYLEEKGNELAAYEQLKALSDVGYDKATAQMEILREAIYQDMIAYYQAKDYDKAYERSSIIGDYKDTEDYNLLLYLRRSKLSFTYKNNSYYMDYAEDRQKIVGLVEKMGNIEGAMDALVGSYRIAEEFLRGTWKTKTGGYYFKIDKEGSASYNIPLIEKNKKYYAIENGQLIHFNAYTTEKGSVVQYTIHPVSHDVIKIYAHKDGKTYTLYRQ